MDDIRAWFNSGKKYEDGIKLYLKHGNDAKLIRLFTAEGYSAFKMQTLTSALDAILSATKPKKTIADVAVKQINRKAEEQITQQPSIEKHWSKERDAVEQSLWLQWKPLFAEMMNLMARLGEVAIAGKKDPEKEQEAGRMALRILDLDDECDMLYNKRDFYLSNNKLPCEEPKHELCLDSKLWGKKLENHTKYARTFRARLKKDPSDTEAAELLQKHEWYVAEYKKLLNMTDAV